MQGGRDEEEALTQRGFYPELPGGRMPTGYTEFPVLEGYLWVIVRDDIAMDPAAVRALVVGALPMARKIRSIALRKERGMAAVDGGLAVVARDWRRS